MEVSEWSDFPFICNLAEIMYIYFVIVIKRYAQEQENEAYIKSDKIQLDSNFKRL